MSAVCRLALFQQQPTVDMSVTQLSSHNSGHVCQSPSCLPTTVDMSVSHPAVFPQQWTCLSPTCLPTTVDMSVTQLSSHNSPQRTHSKRNRGSMKETCRWTTKRDVKKKLRPEPPPSPSTSPSPHCPKQQTEAERGSCCYPMC